MAQPNKTSRTALLALPAIDVRACVFSVSSGKLFTEISERIGALATACAHIAGIASDNNQATPQWNTMSTEGVQVQVGSSPAQSVFVPWGSIETEAAMANYTGWFSQQCQPVTP